jgi:capsule polysaccharide export protein KpsE/RkpR
MLGGQAPAALFAKALASDSILDAVVERCDLKEVYGVSTGTAARLKLAARTQINEDRRSGIVTISVQDHDRYRAVQLANAYVQELDKLLTRISNTGASRERLFLEGRLASVKQNLDEASQDLSSFSSKTGAVNITEQGKATFEGAAKLQTELIDEEGALKGLEQTYAPDNPKVRAMKAQVAEVRRNLSLINLNAASSADSDTGSLPIRELPVLGKTYAALYRRIKIEEAVYEMLSEQYEMAKLQEVRQVPTARAMGPALVPDKKSGPKRSVICLGGLLFSFCGSMFWVITAKKWDEADPGSPGKVLLRTVFRDLRQNRFISRFKSKRTE